MPKVTSKKAIKPLASKAASKKTEAIKPAKALKSAAPAAITTAAAFALQAPQARQVSVCGEFNAWKPEAAPLKRRADGTWETKLSLRPGRYQYKFVVDGNWIHDPNAQQNVPNEHYSLNSVIEIRA